MAQKLTDTMVRKEPAPAKGTKTIWDGGEGAVTGFGVRVYAPTRNRPNGSRSYFLNYRVDGIERRITLGEFPTHKTADARNEAKELRRRIHLGEDPASDRRKRREAPTIQNLADRYVTDHMPKKACFGTYRERDERKMLDQIGDGLGRARRVADVHHGDIEKLHRTISRHTPIRANRILALASKMFSLALTPLPGEQEPWRTAAQGNPCKGVRRNPETGCERFFSEAEIAALADALDMADERSSADCIRLIMLTGCRPIEAMRATWPEFDAEPGFWVRPSAHTKQRKVHKAPLGPAACELIEGLRKNRNSESPWVFPGLSHCEPIKSMRTIWSATRKRATVLLWLNSPNPAVSGLLASIMEQAGRLPSVEETKASAGVAKVSLPHSLENARIYDLRHSFASFGAGAGMGLPIIGKLLGHTQARTTQRYTHLADEPMRKAAEEIGEKIAKAVKSVERRKAKAG
ncbi:MAG: integrase family protein [Rhodomicrobium sp.]